MDGLQVSNPATDQVRIVLSKFFHLRIISDVDGEWGRWKSEESSYQDENNETKVCFQRRRECDKPSPCGENAKECDGDAIDFGNCPGRIT